MVLIYSAYGMQRNLRGPSDCVGFWLCIRTLIRPYSCRVMLHSPTRIRPSFCSPIHESCESLSPTSSPPTSALPSITAKQHQAPAAHLLVAEAIVDNSISSNIWGTKSILGQAIPDPPSEYQELYHSSHDSGRRGCVGSWSWPLKYWTQMRMSLRKRPW